MGLSNMLCTTTDTFPFPILSLISMCSTQSLGCKGHVPVSCVSPTLMGHTITSAVSLSRGFTLHSKIWVWNGSNFTCSFTKMGLSIPLSVDSVDEVWASSAPPTAPSPRSVVPHLLSKHDIQVIAHRTDNLSISLSLITLMILHSIQVPNTRGTHLENSDLVGMMRKTTSSSYPVTSTMGTQRIMNPNGLVRPPPKPTKFTGWSISSSNGRTGNSWHLTYAGVMTFIWLPLSARVIASLPSTTMLTNILGPIQ